MKEFTIFLPAGTRKEGETEVTWHPPRIVETAGFDSFGGVYIKVREISPELDAAHIECEKALEKTLQAAVWFFKGPYGGSPDENCIEEAVAALESLKKARGE